MLSRWFTAVVAASTSAILSASICTVPAWAATPPTPSNGHNITVEGWEQTSDSHIYTATIDSPAIFTPTDSPEVDLRVNIYFPATYDHNRAEGYPVLYALHGGSGQYDAWVTNGDVSSLVEKSGYPGIVVMPEGGRGGFYRNWTGNTKGGFRPLWETFHIDQLIPWVDDNFNTNATKLGRAVTGNSMGGIGTLIYAGRHTDVFGSMASLSGPPDINHTPDDDPDTPGQATEETADEIIRGAGASIASQGHTGPILAPAYQVPGDTREKRLTAVFGARTTWPTWNPLDLAEDGKYNPLSGNMFVYTGSTGSDTEIGRASTDLHEALLDAGVEHRFCKTSGDHNWAAWSVYAVHYMSWLAGKNVSTCPSL